MANDTLLDKDMFSDIEMDNDKDKDDKFANFVEKSVSDGEGVQNPSSNTDDEKSTRGNTVITGPKNIRHKRRNRDTRESRPYINNPRWQQYRRFTNAMQPRRGPFPPRPHPYHQMKPMYPRGEEMMFTMIQLIAKLERKVSSLEEIVYRMNKKLTKYEETRKYTNKTLFKIDANVQHITQALPHRYPYMHNQPAMYR